MTEEAPGYNTGRPPPAVPLEFTVVLYSQPTGSTGAATPAVSQTPEACLFFTPDEGRIHAAMCHKVGMATMVGTFTVLHSHDGSDDASDLRPSEVDLRQAYDTIREAGKIA